MTSTNGDTSEGSFRQLLRGQENSSNIEMMQRMAAAPTANGAGAPERRAGPSTDLRGERPEEWTPEITQQFIFEYSRRLMDVVDEHGDPLFWDAVKNGQLDSARRIVDEAKREGIPVKFRHGESDLLTWAIQCDAERELRFILEKLAEKYASVKETCLLLEKHLQAIGEKHPKLIGEFLKGDRFTVEYARFPVQRSVFNSHDRFPVAMVVQKRLESWDSMSSEAAKGFWIDNCAKRNSSLSRSSDMRVTAVAKFFCIGQSIHCRKTRKQQHFCHFLHENLPVEVFESETLKVMTEWWFRFFRCKYWKSIVMDCLSTAAFTGFALLYGKHVFGGAADHFLFGIGLMVFVFLSHLIGNLQYPSLLRLVTMFAESLLFAHTCARDHHTVLSAFGTSIMCISQWILSFKHTGPIISMVNTAVIDSLSFSLLGIPVIFGYAAAFVVLFKDRSVNDEGEHFTTFPRAFETLTYAGVGNFDVDMFRLSSSFLTVWANFLFGSFVFIAPVVLLSLLVAILTDTYDKVRSDEKAELRKLQMRIVAKFQHQSYSIFSGGQVTRHAKDYGILKNEAQVGEASDGGGALECLSGMYFHFLVPVEDDDGGLGSEEWEGRHMSLKRAIASEGQKNERVLKACEANSKNSTERLTKIEGRLENIEEAIGRLLAAVEQNR